MNASDQFEFDAVQVCRAHALKYNEWKDSEYEAEVLSEPCELELRKELLALVDKCGREEFILWWMRNRKAVKAAGAINPTKDWYVTEYEVLFWQAYHLAKICISPFVEEVK